MTKQEDCKKISLGQKADLFLKWNESIIFLQDQV